jgi:hypothetical protein
MKMRVHETEAESGHHIDREEHRSDPQRSWIEPIRKLRGHHLNGLELVDHYVDEMTLPHDPCPECAAGAGVKNEFV